MAERKEKEEVKVADFTEVFKDLSGLVKDNYLSNLKIALSIWEENQKFANAQIDHFLATQKEYAEQIKAASERFLPKEVFGFWDSSYKAFEGNFNRIIGAQRDYINLVKNVSERLAKNTLSLTQKTAERAFLGFDEYLKFFGA
jgi:predicted  nucleic acid-binding Zn-ribbon protein